MKKRPGRPGLLLGGAFSAAYSAALLTLFVAVRILLAGLALLARLALLLTGLLAGLRLVLAFGLLVILTRLVVLVCHIVLQRVCCPSLW